MDSYENLYRLTQQNARRLGINLELLLVGNEIHRMKKYSKLSINNRGDLIDLSQSSEMIDEILSYESSKEFVNLIFFGQSMCELKMKEGYYGYCCQELASSKRIYWVSRFIHCLTRGELKYYSLHHARSRIKRTKYKLMSQFHNNNQNIFIKTNSKNNNSLSSSKEIQPQANTNTNTNKNIKNGNSSTGSTSPTATNNPKTVGPQLTRKRSKGGSSKPVMLRPMEMHAHDPIRYLSDMLSWIHEALLQEKLFASMVFNHKMMKEMEFEVKDTNDDLMYNSGGINTRERVLSYNNDGMGMGMGMTGNELEIPMFEKFLNFDYYVRNEKDVNMTQVLEHCDKVLEGLYRPLSTRVTSILNISNSVSSQNDGILGSLGSLTGTQSDYNYDVITAFRLCQVFDHYIGNIESVFNSSNNGNNKNKNKNKNLNASLIFDKDKDKDRDELEEEEDEEKEQRKESQDYKFVGLLNDLRSMAYQKFYKMIEYRMDKLLLSSKNRGKKDSEKDELSSALRGQKSNVDSLSGDASLTISSDLSPNYVFKEHCDKLTEILDILGNNDTIGIGMGKNVNINIVSVKSSKDSSPGGIDDENKLNSILNAFIDPMLELLHQMIVNLNESEKCVYCLNVLEIMSESLKNHSFSLQTARYEMLSLLIGNHKDKLIQTQATFILKNCGVFQTLQYLKQFEEERKNEDNDDEAGVDAAGVGEAKEKEQEKVEMMHEFQGLDQDSMIHSMKSLNAYIFSLGAMTMPMIDKINDPHLRNVVRNGVANVIFGAYKMLYDSLLTNSDANGYAIANKDAIAHTPHQVRQVLQLP